MLMDSVSTKIDYILTHHNNVTELLAKKSQVDALIREIETAGKAQITEKTAYTIFNRLVALRFMDVKGYNFVPLVSPYQGSTEPAILTDAKSGIFHPDFPADYTIIKKLVTGSIQNAANPFAEAYKLLFIGVCGYFNTLMPFMFEPLNSYTEILLPDDLLSPGSILALVNENIGEEECANVEVIGWLYQFYISEKKDEVFKTKDKTGQLKADEIPAATQLFTPDWIVRYMVDNTLGKIWIINNPHSELKGKLKYYVETQAEKGEIVTVTNAEELTFLDPCAGSGHTLTYAFDVLYSIYIEEGYSPDSAAGDIIQKNLFGLELDNRAAALAAFAILMKGMEYDRKILFRKIQPNIYSLSDPRLNITDDEVEKNIRAKTQFEVLSLAEFFRNSRVLGSLLLPGESDGFLSPETDKVINNTYEFYGGNLAEKLQYATKVYNLLNTKFKCVVTNPPYINPNVHPVLKEYTTKSYRSAKLDLFACFILRCIWFTERSGLTGMITQHQWMFLSSYELFRKQLIENFRIDTLLHLGPRAFEDISGEKVQSVAFSLVNSKHSDKFGKYLRLIEFRDAKEKINKFFDDSIRFECNQSAYSRIPGSPLVYWMNNTYSKIFQFPSLSTYTFTDGQNITSDNEKYLRNHWEVNKEIIGKGKKWVLAAKGGILRKWYGNILDVMDWAEETRSFYRKNSSSRIQNEYLWFRPGITWSLISSAGASFRSLESDLMCEHAAASLYFDSKYLYLRKYFLGLLNSVVSIKVMTYLSPNYNNNIYNILAIPVIISNFENIDLRVENSINISKQDWDSRETSWDFKRSPLLETEHGGSIEIAYRQYTEYWQEKFFELHRNEEELNRIFIEIYGLEDELTPEVELKDVTILQQEKVITENGELRFKTDELMRQFISYSVGCMMGRYSPDAEGLILANSGETINDYLNQIPSPRFMPDDDGIIPVLSEELFSDDIVSRFMTFLGVVFGEQNVYPNLHFIENAISKNIRSYFYTDFYKDHVKRYKKRPIYWMVSSPQKTFQALIYMHRYHEETLPGVLNNYLIPFAAKLRGRQNDLFRIINDASATGKEKNEAEKKLQALNLKMRETDDFIVTMKKAAEQKISIDLDDGVKVNISKFNGIIIQV